ncbi:MAG TPA: hypothetical protein VG820_00820, partial [Fimbriimonadaceae bacterium]|nr:hypothetical protein [Fimbriimonadaceae bacterium]
QLYVCPTDPDPHGTKLLDTSGNCIGSDPVEAPPGPLSSYILNAYYLFGITSSQVTEPSRSIYISERRDTFCDVHYHPWFNETELPTPTAIASDRHAKGSNGVYTDGHAKWSMFARARAPFDGHELYGEFQAF